MSEKSISTEPSVCIYFNEGRCACNVCICTKYLRVPSATGPLGRQSKPNVRAQPTVNNPIRRPVTVSPSNCPDVKPHGLTENNGTNSTTAIMNATVTVNEARNGPVVADSPGPAQMVCHGPRSLTGVALPTPSTSGPRSLLGQRHCTTTEIFGIDDHPAWVCFR